MDLIAQLAHELNLKAANIEAAVKLIDEGNTIPFISRYRKEATGGMDDVALRALDERLSYLRNLEQRKEDVILLIDAQGKLTPELEQQIREATQLQRVEDLYKPYRKKRMTRAQKAREAGLEPLANMIIVQASAKGSALDAAAAYVNEEAGFDTPEKALAGAADIVAETVPRTPRTSPTCALLRKTPPISSSRPPTPPRRPPTSRTTAMMSRCAVYPTTACWLSTAVSARASSACA